MNIFVLDMNPKLAAQYHCDKHVVKMITESCQLLSTWIRSTDKLKFYPKDLNVFYKPTHTNHPCNKWLHKSMDNVVWLHSLLNALLMEYIFRYDKTYNFTSAHRIYGTLQFYLLKDIIRNTKPTQFELCMPDEYKITYQQNNGYISPLARKIASGIYDPVASYRNYYKKGKSHLLTYTKREKPEWLQELTTHL